MGGTIVKSEAELSEADLGELYSELKEKFDAAPKKVQDKLLSEVTPVVKKEVVKKEPVKKKEPAKNPVAKKATKK
jgi:hypothetical protein